MDKDITLVDSEGIITDIYKSGDTMMLSGFPVKWYIRFWYWVTFRNSPINTELIVIKNIEINGSDVTITMEYI